MGELSPPTCTLRLFAGPDGQHGGGGRPPSASCSGARTSVQEGVHQPGQGQVGGADFVPYSPVVQDALFQCPSR